MEKDEYVEGCTLSKFMGFGLVALGISILFLVEPFYEWGIARWQNPSDFLLVMTLLSVIPFWIIAIFIIQLGLRTKRSGQWPPPDFKPAFRKRIRRGRYAKAMWISLYFFAGSVIVSPFISLYTWYMLNKLINP